jgi:hypothetical protein
MGTNIRYYIEIIPRSTTLYSTPDTLEFPLAALESDWEIESILNDEKIGLKRPDGYKINIDLEMLPEDLRDYILDPFVSHDMASEFPYKASTRVEIPNFDLTNVWVVKTDEGDADALIDDFVILNTFGVKKNPSRLHKITKDGAIQKHELDIILHDLFRVITEAIHPIYLTWLGYEDVQNGTIASPKEVERVYDIAYLTETAKSDYYTVKARSEWASWSYPTTATLGGVTLSVGDKILLSHSLDEYVFVLELVNDSPVQYQLIRQAGPLGDIYSGEIFYVESGTYGDKNYSIYNYTAAGGIGIKGKYSTTEVTVDTGATRVIAKVDGNFNSAIGYYMPVTTLHVYINTVFNFFYRRLMRVASTDTDYELENYGTTNFLSGYRFYKQSFDSDYTVGSAISSLNQLYYCALVERGGVMVGGYLAENDNGNGIYEYENVWDLLENVKGQALTVSYSHDDKKIVVSFDTIKGTINSPSSVIIDYKDLTFGKGSSYQIEENTESMRGVIVNINVPGDDKNEHKYIKAGSISDKELSIKSMFHNNPSLNLLEDGWIETKSFPELKDTLDRLVYKQNNPEMPFDMTKLVYFDTPSSIADSEMAIRPHSGIGVIVNGSLNDHHDMPFSKLPSSNEPWPELKKMFIDLQRFTGMPYATAKQLGEYFSKQGRFLLKAGVLVDTIYNVPVGQGITVDLSDKLLNGDEPNVHFLWLLRSKMIRGDEQEAEIELIGVY